MDRIVRYGTTEDGVRIAYSIEGEGPPLLVCPYFIESFSLDHLSPIIEAFIARLREGRQLIRFDGRGTGLSQREFDGELSLDAHCRDLAAVVNAAQLHETSCLAGGASGPVAAQYAAAHPDKITALILWGTYANCAAAAQFVRQRPARLSRASAEKASAGLAPRMYAAFWPA